MILDTFAFSGKYVTYEITSGLLAYRAKSLFQTPLGVIKYKYLTKLTEAQHRTWFQMGMIQNDSTQIRKANKILYFHISLDMFAAS